ncbi:MAG: hypothetical protein QG622_1474 [Actinomycetota bacterium]|nr:hypothetical protein [Actinomycetota bacterium]
MNRNVDPWSVGGVAPPPPPIWASHSVAEAGAITHETTASLRPTIMQWRSHGPDPVTTAVTLNVVDIRVGDHWVRSRPTVEIEGGSYSLDGAHQLRTAIGSFLASVVAEEIPERDPVLRGHARRAAFAALRVSAGEGRRDPEGIRDPEGRRGPEEGREPEG